MWALLAALDRRRRHRDRAAAVLCEPALRLEGPAARRSASASPPTTCPARSSSAGRTRGCSRKILEFGLQRGEKNRADITDALSIALMENLNSLERNLGVIGTIAVIAPFVGLFGTVLGIIRAFQDIALKGNSTPAVVAAGVSEALITTAAGLFVAVIAVIFFNYFKTRIKAYNQEMIVAANQLAEMLHFHNTGAADPDRPVQAGRPRATK